MSKSHATRPLETDTLQVRVAKNASQQSVVHDHARGKQIRHQPSLLVSYLRSSPVPLLSFCCPAFCPYSYAFPSTQPHSSSLSCFIPLLHFSSLVSSFSPPHLLPKAHTFTPFTSSAPLTLHCSAL